MSEQPLDLRRSMQIARRRKIFIGAVILVGLVAGAAYPVVRPPALSSTALVVLPQPTELQEQQAAAAAGETTTTGTGTGTDPVTATQVVIAGSDPVLAAALPQISPPMSLQSLINAVKASSSTTSVITITAQAKTAAQAENIANAVANSYVAYIGGRDSPVGRIKAQVFQAATQATGPSLAGRVALFGVAGTLAGALIGFVLALAFGRNDRRLRVRDEIANSIGVPVLAAIPVEHPSDAVGWGKLLNHYEPAPVHAWRLRRLLDYFGTTARPGHDVGGISIAVVSVASDPGALALGPQLAVFAASLGVPTTLVMGTQQDPASTAALRTACVAAEQAAPGRSRLRVVVAEDGHFTDPRAALVIVLVVLDGRNPQMPATMPTTTAVVGVSSGGATAEQLARVATAAAVDGYDITGILVADPDPTDQTTGRVPQLGRSVQQKGPTRVTGIPMEIR